jgi:hypothetical protein
MLIPVTSLTVGLKKLTTEAPAKPKKIIHKGNDPVKEQESASTL